MRRVGEMAYMLQQPAFGRRLKALRVARGMSQTALAGEGMSTGYLSRLESGARRPTERAVAYLAEHLGVPVGAFQEVEVDSLASVLASVVSAVDSDDAVEHLAAAVEVEGHDNLALRWQAIWMLATMKNQHGDHAAELGWLRQLTELSDELGSPKLRTRARVRLARCVRMLGSNDQVLEIATEALEIARQHRLSVQDIASVLLIVVSAEAEAGRLPDARAHADELRLLVEGMPGTLPAEALWTAATVGIRQNDFPAAQEFLEAALAGLDSRDDLILWMRLRLAAASLYLQLTEPLVEPARTRLAEATVALQLIGTPRYRQELLTLQAHLAFHEGNVVEARALCDQLEDEQPHLSFRDRIRLDMLRAQLQILDGQVDEGTRWLRALAKGASDALNVDLAAEVWRTLAESLAALGSAGSGPPAQGDGGPAEGDGPPAEG